ncbi:hypothetical protein GPL15_09945 [Clostridium sp. MCC353]|uniref:tripartite tricarboxylate transporter TctB family protein n=1 Tax=Clostridium sp. MCC353 TaxID=2592646 RepID=UPI001C01109A|nr:tripartite tricarboxylate transporter TctB family protein [Clostridium sp. MCC353]MBT9776824.1 hypothetical protein [Clostridium sp. MCC353]
MEKKRYFRLKTRTSLLVPSLVWIFTAAYVAGSRRVLWSDGFLAMRVCLVLLILSTGMVLKNELVIMTREEYFKWKEEEKMPVFTEKARKNLIMFGMLALYMIVLNPLGFAPATAAFILAVMCWLGVRKPGVLIIVPVLTSGILFYLFKYVLYIRLPLGLLKYIL